MLFKDANECLSIFLDTITESYTQLSGGRDFNNKYSKTSKIFYNYSIIIANTGILIIMKTGL